MRVAQFALQQRFERIDFEEGPLKEELEKIALEAGANLSIPQFIIEHEDQTH